jgi:cysteine desulfurase/selenocysteine lyase
MLQKNMHGKPLIYFDTAATAQKPMQVIDAIDNYYRSNYGTVHRAVYELSLFATQKYQEIRHQIQKFLGAAQPEEIIFTRGTTESINLVAYSFGKAFIQPGDEIIISEMEHHSNIVPWQILCEDRGATLRVIRINDRAEIDLDHYAQLLNNKTKLVSVAHIANATGTVNPIKTMIDMAHKWGAKVLIDGAQSAPHQTVNVQALDADFYVFSGHKLYGPTGIGILYGKAELLKAMPPYQGGGDMIETVTFAKTTYNVLPLKFEAGTPMIAEVIGLGAAIVYIQTIGLNSIHQYEQQLLTYATSQLTQIKNLHIIGTAQEKGAITSFVIEGAHPLDIATLLDLRGIAIRSGHLCAQPTMHHFNTSSLCRASYAFYNTFEEIDNFIASLKDVLKLIQ